MDAPCLAKGTSAERKRGRGVKDTKEEDEEEEEEEEEKDEEEEEERVGGERRRREEDEEEEEEEKERETAEHIETPQINITFQAITTSKQKYKSNKST